MLSDHVWGFKTDISAMECLCKKVASGSQCGGAGSGSEKHAMAHMKDS